MIVGIVVTVVLFLMITAAVMKFSDDNAVLRNRIKDQKVEMRTLHLRIDSQNTRINELRRDIEILKAKQRPTWPPYQPPPNQGWPKPTVIWSNIRGTGDWK